MEIFLTFLNVCGVFVCFMGVDVLRYELKKALDRLRSIRGRGTELISVYVPDGFSINLITSMLSSERSEASNIKSKATRKNVIAAIDKILQELKKYKKTPENGLVIFCGNVGGDDRVDIRLWVLVPPEPLKTKMYKCDQVFWLDPLEEMLDFEERYLIVSIDQHEFAVGVLRGKRVVTLMKGVSHIPGKQRQGGQSAPRFQRQRKEVKQQFLKSVGLYVQQVMRERGLEKIILGGPGFMKEELNSSKYLGPFVDMVVGVVDTGYAGEDGFEEILFKSEELLKGEELLREKRELRVFFETLAKKPNLVCYGLEECKRLIVQGVVKKLFLSEGLSSETVKELSDLSSKCGVEVLIVSMDTREGSSLWKLGGVGGVLRYSVNS